MSGKREDNKKKKLAVLQVIKENKSTLFGSFGGNKLTAQEKEDAWKVVADHAKSVGLISADKQWAYVRDNLFGLWKSRALAKRDNARKTGTGGGKQNKPDEVDETIFEIVEKESPVLDGLDGVPESSGCISSSAEKYENVKFNHKPKIKITEKKKHEGEKERIKRKNENNNCTSKENIFKLKEELIQVEIYKTKLESFKLERELKLPPSKYTQEFIQPATKAPSATYCCVSYSDSDSELE